MHTHFKVTDFKATVTGQEQVSTSNTCASRKGLSHGHKIVSTHGPTEMPQVPKARNCLQCQPQVRNLPPSKHPVSPMSARLYKAENWAQMPQQEICVINQCMTACISCKKQKNKWTHSYSPLKENLGLERMNLNVCLNKQVTCPKEGTDVRAKLQAHLPDGSLPSNATNCRPNKKMVCI